MLKFHSALEQVPKQKLKDTITNPRLKITAQSKQMHLLREVSRAAVNFYKRNKKKKNKK